MVNRRSRRADRTREQIPTARRLEPDRPIRWAIPSGQVEDIQRLSMELARLFQSLRPVMHDAQVVVNRRDLSRVRAIFQLTIDGDRASIGGRGLGVLPQMMMDVTDAVIGQRCFLSIAGVVVAALSSQSVVKHQHIFENLGSTLGQHGPHVALGLTIFTKCLGRGDPFGREPLVNPVKDFQGESRGVLGPRAVFRFPIQQPRGVPIAYRRAAGHDT